MRNPLFTWLLALSAGPLAASLQAQESAPDASDPNWFSFGPQFGLNINARFLHLGNVSPGSPGPATGGGVDRTYNNGFVKVDSSGNAGGQTWNWGYQNASQVQGSTLNFSSSSAAINGTLNQNDDPQPGFDLAYGRRLGTVLGGQWGVQAAFDFTTISIDDHQPVSGSGTTVSDSYSLGAVVPPPAPYAGSFNGPGPLLNDSPTRTTASETVSISGSRTLDAQIYAFRAGSYYEFQFGQHWSGRRGGGLAGGLADTRYSYNETITFPGGTSFNNAGSGQGVSVQAGGYLQGELLYALTPVTSLFASVQYENLGTISQNAGNEQAQLDMSSTINVLFGVQFNF